MVVFLTCWCRDVVTATNSIFIISRVQRSPLVLLGLRGRQHVVKLIQSDAAQVHVLQGRSLPASAEWKIAMYNNKRGLIGSVVPMRSYGKCWNWSRSSREWCGDNERYRWGSGWPRRRNRTEPRFESLRRGCGSTRRLFLFGGFDKVPPLTWVWMVSLNAFVGIACAAW